jgi:CRP/FNR family transcriptional regulator, cyclic AMP receptor protein
MVRLERSLEENPVPTTTDTLRSIPLFEGMTDRSIEAISELAAPITFGPGATLVREGDPGDSFLVILDGSATVTEGGAVIRTLRAGDFLGEVSLLDGGRRSATVTAASDVRGLVIDREGFQRLMDDFPVVRLEIVTALSQRLRARAPEVTD